MLITVNEYHLSRSITYPNSYTDPLRAPLNPRLDFNLSLFGYEYTQPQKRNINMRKFTLL